MRKTTEDRKDYPNGPVRFATFPIPVKKPQSHNATAYFGFFKTLQMM